MLGIDRDGAHDFLANVRSVLSGEKVISNSGFFFNIGGRKN